MKLPASAVLVASIAVLGACSGGGDSGGGSPCANACSAIGATQCSGVQVRTCEAGSDGCLAWSASAACPTGLTCVAQLEACAGDAVTLSWSANRESGVNRAGGGYEVRISGQAPVVVPYVSGATAPTAAALQLQPGSYTATVRAFAALDSQGGTTRTYSASSEALSFSVP